MDEPRSAQRYLEDLTPGGSEYFDNPKRCYEWAYGRIESAHRIALDAALERNRLWDENKRLTEQVRIAELELVVLRSAFEHLERDHGCKGYSRVTATLRERGRPLPYPLDDIDPS